MIESRDGAIDLSAAKLTCSAQRVGCVRTGPTVAADWLVDAELMVITPKNLGTFNKPLQTDSLILGETDWNN
jgi:hypothetical protein